MDDYYRVIRSILLSMAIVIVLLFAAWAVWQSTAMVDAQVRAEFYEWMEVTKCANTGS